MAAVAIWCATLAVVPNNDGATLARDGDGWTAAAIRRGATQTAQAPQRNT